MTNKTNVRSSAAAAAAPQLSVTAMFDDMCRSGNALVDTTEDEKFAQLVVNFESVRCLWLQTRNELILTQQKVTDMTEERNKLEESLKRLRLGFAKELKEKDFHRKQSNLLMKQLTAIKDFVLNETDSSPEETRDRLLSYIPLDTVLEEHESDNSFEDLLYDKSGDDIVDESTKHTLIRNSLAPNTAETTQIPTSMDVVSISTEKSDTNLRRSKSDTSLTKADPTDNRKTIKSVSDAIDVGKENIDIRYLMSTPALKRPSSAALTSQQFLSTVSLKTGFAVKAHTFQTKRAITSTKCRICNKGITFLSHYVCCEVCLGLAHSQCKDRLPIPCIPFRKQTSSKHLTASSTRHMSLIADFAPDIRPMVPSILVHIFKEIESRGLHEEGIYRKAGAEVAVKELTRKLVNPKTRTQLLESYDIHLLANVVKQFLQQLDEPLITKVLWRDFIRASDQKTKNDMTSLMLTTMDEMPAANCDSLAYLMCHLHRVVKESNKNLMNAKALAKVFAPTVVGHSDATVPSAEMVSRNRAQIKLMEAFFAIPEEEYRKLLADAELSYSTCGTNTKWSPSRRRKRRSSLANTGPLTPIRSSLMPIKESETNHELKPLF
ncbi:unnamed protein product [Medioppia subpectinata]|uniref:Rac GTPase-activating protein 1 n=1 Tax=Medioppia subpectinata TaxID=1979941 RepID=A0A7R9KP22_9ACAR|nr:unnamed protein product [Medioppia subpectinata]CAG2107165.1 unnamed protein product [Medioppia subpectinata]